MRASFGNGPLTRNSALVRRTLLSRLLTDSKSHGLLQQGRDLTAAGQRRRDPRWTRVRATLMRHPNLRPRPDEAYEPVLGEVTQPAMSFEPGYDILRNV